MRHLMDKIFKDSSIIFIFESEILLPNQGRSKWFMKIKRAEFSKLLKKIAEYVKPRTSVISETLNLLETIWTPCASVTLHYSSYL